MTEKELKKLNKRMDELNKLIKESFKPFQEAIVALNQIAERLCSAGIDMAAAGTRDNYIETDTLYTDGKIVSVVGVVNKPRELTISDVDALKQQYDFRSHHDIKTNADILIFESRHEGIITIEKVLKFEYVYDGVKITDITPEYVSELNKR